MADRPNRPQTPLDGNHHVTGITSDVKANLDFWCRVMGLRFVKKTLNFETTFRYHTYYGDETGDPGSVVTFLEFNEAPKAQPGKGNIAAAILRVGSYEALEYWMDRLTQEQIFSEMIRLDPTQPTRLVFSDHEGHRVELIESDAPDKPLAAPASDIPEEFRIRGIEGVRSYCNPDELSTAA
ncbi:VOC family protein [Paracoccus pacificus]|uniref:VOC family protein n=1 Tax=Paracoccus pacificus TaxID=1463598 RepID=A0ABW4R4T6_9RHOB